MRDPHLSDFLKVLEQSSYLSYDLEGGHLFVFE